MGLDLIGYRNLIRAELRDMNGAVWTDAQLDHALRAALGEYSLALPRQVIGQVTLASDGWEIDVSGLSGLLGVWEVWLPYEDDLFDGAARPRRRAYRLLTSALLRIEGGSRPAAGDVARVFYYAMHTVNGLDGASVTTVSTWHEQELARGAAALAAEARARQVGESENVTGGARFVTRRWAEDAGDRWRRWLARQGAAQTGVLQWGEG